MEPLSAVSLAGNLIQFVEISSSLVSGALDLYASADGASAINVELETITEDLVGICSSIHRPRNLIEEKQMPKAESDLLKLSRSCLKLGNEFVQVLQNLKVKGRNRKWSSVRQALRSMWKEKDIERYRKRLESYRSEIACHLLFELK